MMTKTNDQGIGFRGSKELGLHLAANAWVSVTLVGRDNHIHAFLFDTGGREFCETGWFDAFYCSNERLKAGRRFDFWGIG